MYCFTIEMNILFYLNMREYFSTRRPMFLLQSHQSEQIKYRWSHHQFYCRYRLSEKKRNIQKQWINLRNRWSKCNDLDSIQCSPEKSQFNFMILLGSHSLIIFIIHSYHISIFLGSSLGLLWFSKDDPYYPIWQCLLCRASLNECFKWLAWWRWNRSAFDTIYFRTL